MTDSERSEAMEMWMELESAVYDPSDFLLEQAVRALEDEFDEERDSLESRIVCLGMANEHLAERCAALQARLSWVIFMLAVAVIACVMVWLGRL